MVPNCIYRGIEPRTKAAEIAQSRLDQVLVGSLEDFDLEAEGISKGSIDGLIFADVLEHLYNPWNALVQLKPYLTPNGELITSIPNLANLLQLMALAHGQFAYEATGIMDITHIRFFTLAQQLQMLEQTGFKPQHIGVQIIPELVQIYQHYQNIEKSNPGQKHDLDLGKLVLKELDFEEITQRCALAYIIRSVPNTD